MLKSCQYCGRIHDDKAPCKARDKARAERDRFNDRTRKDRNSKADRFRHTGAWKKKRDYILHRDRRLCLCCLAELPGTEVRYQTEGLSVHHITPIVEDYDKRLMESNLITVCVAHHELCERGLIDKETQRRLVRESQEGKLH